jgi:hypothetical protein
MLLRCALTSTDHSQLDGFGECAGREPCGVNRGLYPARSSSGLGFVTAGQVDPARRTEPNMTVRSFVIARSRDWVGSAAEVDAVAYIDR